MLANITMRSSIAQGPISQSDPMTWFFVLMSPLRKPASTFRHAAPDANPRKGATMLRFSAIAHFTIK
jgi:hypothetical protein